MLSLVTGTAREPRLERGNVVEESAGETIEAILRELLMEGLKRDGPVLLRFREWRL